MDARLRLLIALLFLGGEALAFPVVCPERYYVDSAPVAVGAQGVPKDWTMYLQGHFRLRAAGVHELHPDNLTKPLVYERKNGAVEAVYSGLASDSWAACYYGVSEQSDVVLVQRLPSSVKRCVVRYRRVGDNGAQKLEAFDCE